jgi:hypothetical protein
VPGSAEAADANAARKCKITMVITGSSQQHTTVLRRKDSIRTGKLLGLRPSSPRGVTRTGICGGRTAAIRYAANAALGVE